MAGDPAMVQLNTLLDHLWWADIQRQRRAFDARDDDPGSAASAAAQEHYEAGLLEEARAIVTGESEAAPTVEHLRIALAWLDGALSAPQQTDGGSPF